MTADVPCNGCFVCCAGPDRECELAPDDDASEYQTYTDNGRTMLAKKANGDCIYLKDGACSIYADRPNVCRNYDCRDYVYNPATPFAVRWAAMKIMQ